MKIGLRYQIYSLFSRGLAERESSLFFVLFPPEISDGRLTGGGLFFSLKNRMFLLQPVVNMYAPFPGFAHRFLSVTQPLSAGVGRGGKRVVLSGIAFFLLAVFRPGR